MSGLMFMYNLFSLQSNMETVGNTIITFIKYVLKK